ncbi:MAG: hypothetical protein JWM05_87 [Acidimicrobiales bacterium]|nr:hypothetical protein [Acidimicrobiales bacterium]
MRKILVSVLTVGLLGVAGCGSSSKGSPSSTSPAAGPSKQAKMVCSTEAQRDLGRALSLKPSAPVRDHWSAPDYSCTYRYGAASFRLTVRDLPDRAATIRYFTEQLAKHGRKSSIPLGADDAALLRDDGLLARKDRHVLLVDVTGLPARFGKPPVPRTQIAYTVGGVIMACWKGDAS